METLKFKGQVYKFERTVETLLSSEYVPDWDMFHALRESLQNALDEQTQTGCAVGHTVKDNCISLWDKGRGVELEKILLLGISGKRGVAGMVGQHGEGEIVGTLVATRLDVVKTMASQNWAIVGRLSNGNDYRWLVLDVYRAKNPIVGTYWRYDGSGQGFDLSYPFERALGVFTLKERQNKAQIREERARAR